MNIDVKINPDRMNEPHDSKYILPNFLIVGSAKCGTSSLHTYLAQHPQIFMSKKKEPRFISSQGMKFPLNGPKDSGVESWYVKTFDEYVKLFESANGYQVVGESSADTLYFYSHTIPTIKKYLGNPKILILLRNPVKRSYSAYQHLVRDMREEYSFEEALQHESERIRNNWELIYHYRNVSRYYEPVKAFLENFSDVKIVLNEDLEKQPANTLRDIFNFLGVSQDFEVKDTSVKYNLSGKPRSRWLHNFFFKGHPLQGLMRPVVRVFFPGETRKRISLRIQQMNLRRTKINPETANKLLEEYKGEIEQLQQLTSLDLSRWLKKFE
jgi:hypothetical protein